MDYIDNAYNGLTRYFKVLESVGQYKERNAIGLLIYCFIVDQVFNGPLQPYLDDTGLSAFNKAIKCISQSGCLVPMLSPGIHISPARKYYVGNSYRSTERGILRNTEDLRVRITESSEMSQN
jgi:hypothetical protein